MTKYFNVLRLCISLADRENVQVVGGVGTADVVGERKELPFEHDADVDGQLVKGTRLN